MRLDDFATPLVAADHFIKASFGGFAGSGKTRTASEFVAGAYKQLGCKKPVLFQDNEHGSRFLVPFFKAQGIEVRVKNSTTLADVLQGFEFLKAGDIDFFFLDSASKVWYQYVRDYRAKNRVTFMSLQDWGKIIPAWQEEFSDRFVDCSGNIVFTGRGGFSYEKEEDEVDERTGRIRKGQFVKSGVKMKMAGETPFEPDLNVWMELKQEVNGEVKVWREAQIMKDRSGTIDGQVFKNPTYEAFKPVLDFLCGVPTGDVAGVSDDTNHAPAEDSEWPREKQQRAIACEEIMGQLTATYPGQSAREKLLKGHAIKRTFGTFSWTKVEGMKSDVLRAGLDNLRKMLGDRQAFEESVQNEIDQQQAPTA